MRISLFSLVLVNCYLHKENLTLMQTAVSQLILAKNTLSY